MHGISTTRNHHAIISMTGGTCQQEHTGTHPHTQSELFSVDCQVCICRSCSNLLLHTIALHRTSSSSQVLHSSLPSAHGLNAMHWICVRVTDERLHMTEISMHTLHTLLTLNTYIANITYIMPSMKSHTHNIMVRCHQSCAQVQAPFRRPHSTRLQTLECQQPQSPHPHAPPLL